MLESGPVSRRPVRTSRRSPSRGRPRARRSRSAAPAGRAAVAARRRRSRRTDTSAPESSGVPGVQSGCGTSQCQASLQRPHGVMPEARTRLRDEPNGAAPESNRPSRGLHGRTGFEDQLGHRAPAAPSRSVSVACPSGVVRIGRRRRAWPAGRLDLGGLGGTAKKGAHGGNLVSPCRYGMKFKVSGSGPTIGVSNSGPAPSGSMVTVPADARNIANCACAATASGAAAPPRLVRKVCGFVIV